MNILARIRGSITQRDMAKRINIPGVDGAMISKVENGWCNPLPEHIDLYNQGYGIDLVSTFASRFDYGVKSAHSKDKRVGDRSIQRICIRTSADVKLRLANQMAAHGISTYEAMLVYLLDREETRWRRYQKRRQKKTAQAVATSEDGKRKSHCSQDTPVKEVCQDGTDNDGRRTAAV